MSVVSLFIKEYGVIAAAFIVGILLGARGCGEPEPETITIEKLVPTVEYVDRWKTDSVRYVSKSIIETFDTILSEQIVMRLDTLILIDTVKIVEAWLSEKLNYDTIAQFKSSSVRVSWSNYQNQSERLQISLSSSPEKLRIGLYARGGVITDFKSSTSPVIGGGILLSRKRFIFGVDYGYSINHQISGILGYQL